MKENDEVSDMGSEDGDDWAKWEVASDSDPSSDSEGWIDVSSDSDNGLEISDSEDEKVEKDEQKRGKDAGPDDETTDGDSDDEDKENDIDGSHDGTEEDSDEVPQLIDHSQNIATTKVK